MINIVKSCKGVMVGIYKLDIRYLVKREQEKLKEEKADEFFLTWIFDGFKVGGVFQLLGINI